MDTIIEALLGRFDRKTILHNGTLQIQIMNDERIMRYLRETRLYLESWNSFIGESEILNLRDDLVAKIDKALYLMTLN